MLLVADRKIVFVLVSMSDHSAKIKWVSCLRVTEDWTLGCEGQIECVGAPSMQPWLGPRLSLAVACGNLKGGRADWLVEKATELGAQSLMPLSTHRSQVCCACLSNEAFSASLFAIAGFVLQHCQDEC